MSGIVCAPQWLVVRKAEIKTKSPFAALWWVADYSALHHNKLVVML